MKPSVGSKIVGRLKEFTEALERNDKISDNFTCHKVVLDLKPSRYGPELVKATRTILHVSQALFATFLGVKLNTVQAWEQGASQPSDMACRFMDEIRQDPDYWTGRLQRHMVRKSAET
jgi:DNA-binding transcriptional regulator YiaG